MSAPAQQGIRWFAGPREWLLPGHSYCLWLLATSSAQTEHMATAMRSAGLPPILGPSQWRAAPAGPELGAGRYVTLIPFEVERDRLSGEVNATLGVLASTTGAIPVGTAVGEFAQGTTAAEWLRSLPEDIARALAAAAAIARRAAHAAAMLPLQLALAGLVALAVAYVAGWRP